MAWLSGYSKRFPITADTTGLVADVSSAALPIRPGDLTGLCQADMDDAVFTLADGTTPMLHYWESKVLAAPVGHVLVPTLTAGQAAYPVGYLYTGNAGASDSSNEAGVFAGYVARYGLSEASGNFADSCGHYLGTAANIETYADTGQVGTAARFNGNNSNINLGDVTQLNSASAFTLSFWMNQDVLDQTDVICAKGTGVSNWVRISTGTTGNFVLRICDGSDKNGTFDYSQVISAGSWAHIAMSYDGTAVDNAGRLKAYVAGAPVALSYTGTIPATTAGLSGLALVLGGAAAALDGKLDEVRIRATAETPSDVKAQYLAGLGTLFTLGTVEAFAVGGSRGHVQHFGPALLPIGV
jgi:hypothetical protein